MPGQWRCASCLVVCHNVDLQTCPRCKTSRTPVTPAKVKPTSWCCEFCWTENNDVARKTCYWCKKTRAQAISKSTAGVSKQVANPAQRSPNAGKPAIIIAAPKAKAKASVGSSPAVPTPKAPPRVADACASLRNLDAISNASTAASVQGACCHHCNKMGHLAKDCPSVTCHWCGEKGHSKSECPEFICYFCRGQGHTKDCCPRIGKQQQSKRSCCTRCGRAGHTVEECTA